MSYNKTLKLYKENGAFDRDEVLSHIISTRESLKKRQNSHRFEHTLGVAYTAAAMAFIYGEEPLKAELTGLLHDCAKCFSNDELIELCKKDGIELSPEEIASPQVIHAKYGRFLAYHEYGIRDEDMLNAIAFHTTGRLQMSVLEKIIFTADYIEPLRNEAPHLASLRRLAFTDLTGCVYSILEQTVGYLRQQGKDIVPDTLRAYEWYKNERTDL